MPGISGQPVVVAASGGMKHDSTLSVLKVTGDDLNALTPAGSVILSRKQGGTCPASANIPCFPEIPKGAAQPQKAHALK